MKTVDVMTADTMALVAAYRKSAAEHGAATEQGDHRTANRRHDLVADVYRELRRRGIDAQRELLQLLDDIDVYVRAWTAAHALEFAPDRGEPVLKVLATKGGVVGLNARLTLQEWAKGSLTFP